MKSDKPMIWTAEHSPADCCNTKRRALLRALAVTSVAAGCVPIAMPVLARELTWSDIKYVLKLNFVRFVGGLLFDVVEVVLVDYVTRGSHGGYAMYSGIPADRGDFHHAAYKEAIITIHPVRYGMSEAAYQAYRSQKDQIILSRDEDMERFEVLHRHLMDTRTRIALVGDNSSRKITADLKPDALFNIRYLVFQDNNADRHYQALLEETGVSVFDRLVSWSRARAV